MNITDIIKAQQEELEVNYDEIRRRYNFDLEMMHAEIISQTVERTVEAVVATLLSKAKLVDNPVEDNGELVDGSYYCIYKGEFQSLKDQVSNK
jgi:hypothetical protein